MLFTLSLLLSVGRLVRTRRVTVTDRTCLCRNTVRCRDFIRLVKHNGLWSAPSDSVPPNVPFFQRKTFGNVQKQDLTFLGNPLHRLVLEAHRLVEIRRAASLMTAGAGDGEVGLVRQLEAAAVGPVVRPGVVSLVADRERPGAGGLPDEVHQVASTVGGEVAHVVVVGCFGLGRVVHGRVVHGRLARVGVHGSICSRGPAGREPGVYSETGQ